MRVPDVSLLRSRSSRYAFSAAGVFVAVFFVVSMHHPLIADLMRDGNAWMFSVAFAAIITLGFAVLLGQLGSGHRSAV